MIPAAPCRRSRRASSRVGRLLEPLVVGRLLGGRGRLDRLNAPEEGEPPRADRVARAPVLHPWPLLVDDVPAVAFELAAQSGARARRKELRRLVLLHDRERLGLGAAPRLVVAREGEEDDEPREDREPGREDAEHPGRAVAVGEVAPLRRPPPDEEDRADGDRNGGDEDEDAHGERHRRYRLVVRSVTTITPDGLARFAPL